MEHFVEAQERVIDRVREELRAGRKRTHWMWFVFPQLRGLGHSAMAERYGLESVEEARAFLAHPVLGPRLRECCALVLNAPADLTARELFGSPDDLKFRSCVTLFSLAAPEEPLFRRCLERFYGGAPDPRTVSLSASRAPRA